MTDADMKQLMVALPEPPSEQARDDESSRSDAVIAEYLMEKSKEFQRLTRACEEGWTLEGGDKYFKNQRRIADQANEKANKKNANFFFRMMEGIGKELDSFAGGLTVPYSNGTKPSILDFCMAPGGYLKTAMSLNPGASAVAFALPVSSGGHEVLMDKDVNDMPTNRNINLKYLDITMLAADMGVSDIPREHPDAANFLTQQLAADAKFDLILCDGQVLRTHTRATYRERHREARRLAATQLALGLEHVKPGGKMVVLLHKIEEWDNANMLYQFNKFSTIRIFKSRKQHAKRSAFYMVATNVQALHLQAVLAIENWKRMWKVATFGTDEEYKEDVSRGDEDVDGMLKEFGTKLVKLATPSWVIQTKALEAWIKSEKQKQR